MVHGSWHGGWCWKRVVPFLTMNGHEVHTPTLSGCGEHAHTATRQIDLNAHVEDIRAYLFLHDLADVILVGHSYAGMVITGAVDVIPQRIARLVYFDAFVPQDGDSLAALLGMRRAPNAAGSPWLTPAPPPAQLGVTMDVDSSWLAARLTAAPAGPAYSTLHLHTDAAARVPKSYIRCREGLDRMLRFAEQARRAHWDYHELDAGHDAMVTKPHATAEVMLAIAALRV